MYNRTGQFGFKKRNVRKTKCKNREINPSVGYTLNENQLFL